MSQFEEIPSPGRGFQGLPRLGLAACKTLGMPSKPARSSGGTACGTQPCLEAERDARRPRLRRDGRPAGGHGDAAPALRPLPERIWLVDDVMTTGSTLSEAARAARRAGAREVVGQCIAATPPVREA